VEDFTINELPALSKGGSLDEEEKRNSSKIARYSGISEK
jgi:hypothetical protein